MSSEFEPANNFNQRYLLQCVRALEVIKLDIIEKHKYLNGLKEGIEGVTGDPDAPVHWFMALGEEMQRDTIRGLLVYARDYIEYQWIKNVYTDAGVVPGMSELEYVEHVKKMLGSQMGSSN